MPYIDPNQTKLMRAAIRKALPQYDVSVRTEHHSTVDVRLMSGPIPPVPVNVYWYKEHLKNNPDALAVVDTIMNEIHKVQTPRELVYDGDYGSVPTFYINISFGK